MVQLFSSESRASLIVASIPIAMNRLDSGFQRDWASIGYPASKIRVSARVSFARRNRKWGSYIRSCR